MTPKDACPAYNTETDMPIWPGAKMTAEADYDGWYSITVPFEDTSTGAVMIFNNLVADTKADTTTGGNSTDQKFLEASGLIMNTELKRQSPNAVIRAKDFTTKEFWCDFDGNTAGSTIKLLAAKPDSYKKKASTVVNNLETVGVSSKQIKLTWDKYDGAAKYKVCLVDSKTKKTKSTVGTATKTSFTVSKISGKAIKKGTSYLFKVNAYDKSGKMVAESSVVGGVALDIPTVKSVSNSTKGRATVKVNTVSGASGYIIYRSTKAKSGYVAIGETTKTTYTDKTVKKGKTYYYKVAAYKLISKAKAKTIVSEKDYKKIKVTK